MRECSSVVHYNLQPLLERCRVMARSVNPCRLLVAPSIWMATCRRPGHNCDTFHKTTKSVDRVIRTGGQPDRRRRPSKLCVVVIRDGTTDGTDRPRAGLRLSASSSFQFLSLSGPGASFFLQIRSLHGASLVGSPFSQEPIQVP